MIGSYLNRPRPLCFLWHCLTKQYRITNQILENKTKHYKESAKWKLTIMAYYYATNAVQLMGYSPELRLWHEQYKMLFFCFQREISKKLPWNWMWFYPRREMALFNHFHLNIVSWRIRHVFRSKNELLEEHTIFNNK